MLENVKVGDKLWSPVYGWGEVDNIHFNHHQLGVNFSNEYIYYGLNGMKNGRQILFWDEIDMTPPPKPKREVTVEGYVNLYFNDKSTSSLWAGMVFKTETLADGFASPERLGKAVHIKHTYMEES